MKKMFFLLTFLFGTMAVHAEDYTYLTFETTDGAKISVEVSSLNLSFSGTNLIAGEQTFALSNLSKMYFSSSNETTGINEELRVKNEDFSTAQFFDLQGRTVTKEQMRSGQVYVVKSKSGTYKIAVK